MSKTTMVINIRIGHNTLAMLTEYYEANNVKFPSLSSIARAAIEDYAALLLARNLTHEFETRAALERISHMHMQKSRSHVGRSELTKHLLAQPMIVPKAVTVSQETIDEVLRNLGAATVKKSQKEE